MPGDYHRGVDRAEHWNALYRSRGPDRVSWYEQEPLTSLGFLRRTIAAGAASAIDVGGGASTLVDRLLDAGLQRVAVLDISRAALDLAEQRLGARGGVQWITGDVTELEDVGSYDMWHDRAVFHFLIDEDQRARYMSLAKRTIPPGGHVIIATFALDGPERCSGLEVHRYDSDGLAVEFGDGFTLLDSVDTVHTTPRGVSQAFMYALFQRR